MTNKPAWSDSKLLTKYRGVLRDCPVYVGGKEAMKADMLNHALLEWCRAMNKVIADTPLISPRKEKTSRDLHVSYEKIHPFVDGNGRTGRMLMNWWRVREGLPLLVIHEGKEQREYYKWFKQQ
jgi:hypothetical protein